MRFVFDEARTAQAAACLVSLGGGEMNYMKLIKLLYLSDREALIKTGLPITGDRWVSMPRGPVLSNTLDLIKESDGRADSPWHEWLITRAARRSVAVRGNDPEYDELSQFHIDTLNGVFAKWGALDQWQLQDLTHKLPEWEDPNGSSVTIDPRAVLEHEGVSPERIEDIERDAEEDLLVRSLERSIS
jgi:uncharacterized phage-associated protein